MEVRELGRSGLKVGALGLGAMTFGAQTDRADSFRQMDLAAAAGVNLFDVAENYPAPVAAETQGRSEEILGAWLRERGARDRIVLATKVAGPRGMPHVRGENRRLDRQNIRQAVEGSLRRLQSDYIDLYQLHWPERLIPTAVRPRFTAIGDAPGETPIEATLEAMAELVREGKVRCVGVSNETPWGLMRYLALAAERGLPRIVSTQNVYNLLHRGFETGCAEVAVREQVGLLAYSPLAGGLLTGKYVDAEPAADSRMKVFPGAAGRLRNERLRSATSAYVEIARRHGLDPAAMAVAFVRQQAFVASVLVAASKSSQLEANIAAAELVLSDEVVKEINAVHDAAPNPAW